MSGRSAGTVKAPTAVGAAGKADSADSVLCYLVAAAAAAFARAHPRMELFVLVNKRGDNSFQGVDLAVRMDRDPFRTNSFIRL